MNKTVIITGTSSGVGKQCVERFLNKKWNVIGLSRTNVDLYNANYFHIKTDIKDPVSIKNSFEIISKKYNSIDLLINNAAVFKMKPFVEFNEEEIDDIIDTNIKGTIFCTLNTIKIMNKGRIINISSVSGTHGIENQSVYSSTKYALNGFAESLNQELIKKNILISTICPGGINTPLWNDKNQYPGSDVTKILNPNDIVNMIEYIVDLPENVVLKNVTLFPTCEWH
jgi:NADP-dependent 3-hydroxy acid dehydrogenase YdfG